MHAIRSRMRTRLHRLVAAGVVTSIALLLAGVAGVGQYPDCNWKCTSRDVQAVEAFVDAPATCMPGTAVSGTLYATFDNGTNANRYAVRLIGGLYVDGRLEESLEVCALSTMPPGQSTAALTSLSWTCGEDVELRIVTVSWVARPSTCADTPSTVIPELVSRMPRHTVITRPGDTDVRPVPLVAWLGRELYSDTSSHVWLRLTGGEVWFVPVEPPN